MFVSILDFLLLIRHQAESGILYSWLIEKMNLFLDILNT
jgi:hypothetical protein